MSALPALLERLDALFENVTRGPVHQVGVHVEGGTDDEVRHIAKCGWKGEAEFYVALRNAYPALRQELESLRREDTVDSVGNWQCRDYANGWITFPDRKSAEQYQHDTGAMMRYRRYYAAIDAQRQGE